jgi:hypothetical protein
MSRGLSTGWLEGVKATNLKFDYFGRVHLCTVRRVHNKLCSAEKFANVGFRAEQRCTANLIQGAFMHPTIFLRVALLTELASKIPR